MPRQPHPVDLAVRLLAEEQDGCFSVAQAIAAGATDALIYRRRRSGAWTTEAPAVLGFPGLKRTPRRELRIALLDAGPGAWAGYESSAALRDVKGYVLDELEKPSIVVAHGKCHKSSLATVHQTRLMPVIEEVDGFPSSSLLRTILDLSSTLTPLELGRIIDDEIVRKRLTLEQIGKGAAWMRRHRRVGSATLDAALLGRTHGYVPSRSELERILDAIVATIPGVELHHEVNLPRRRAEAHRVDRLSFEPPLIIEADGRLWHARLDDMDKDRRRDRAALLLGYPTVRYGWYDLTQLASEVRHELRTLLVDRPSLSISGGVSTRSR